MRVRPVRSSGFSRSRRVLWPSKDGTTNKVVQKVGGAPVPNEGEFVFDDDEARASIRIFARPRLPDFGFDCFGVADSICHHRTDPSNQR